MHMLVSNCRLAWRLLRRDARAGELRVLAAALVIAVASVASVAFFTDRVKAGLNAQADKLLGADLMLSADRPLPISFADQAQHLGLAMVRSVRFNSMVLPGGGDASSPVLAEVRAVTEGYPLRGEVLLADERDPAGRKATGIPARGTVWIDQRLALRANLQVGGAITLGQSTLRIAAIIQQEPEMSMGIMALAPKLMMNDADVRGTELLQPGNRATYRLLLAGDDIPAFRAWAERNLGPGQRMENIRELRPEVKGALERAEKFLGLAALVAVILSAVAVALATGRYLRRHFDACAVMRCLGAPQRQTFLLYLLQFLCLGVTASAIGVALGIAGQWLLVLLLQNLIGSTLPWADWNPAWQALATGLALLAGFALPPLAALSRIPPLRVLRRDLGLPRVGGWAAYLAGFAAIAGLVYWRAADPKLGSYVLGGMAATLAAALLAAWLLLALARAVPRRGFNWRFGLANLHRRPLASSLQIAALGLGLMALLLLTLVRSDLLANWRSSLPPDAPNRFLINIQPGQAEPLAQLLKGRGADARLYPMVRGRLTAINGKPVSAESYGDERAKRLVDREFNLSSSQALPPDNRLVSGQWWGVDARGQISLEDGIARTLGIKLQDRLTYDIAGQKIEVQVANLRRVEWGNFRVNFFAILPPRDLAGLPASYITAFRLPETDRETMVQLVQQFPNVLVIDVSEIIHQVQSIMDQVAQAVQFVFLFTLLAGLLVLQAAIAATQDERAFDAAVLRTLGASRGQMRSAQLTEFIALGSLSGVLAASGATALAWVLAKRVFDIPFTLDPWLWAIGLFGGAAGVALAGWLGTRSTLGQPPIAVLRRYA
jgi:putative ABC transport system permease protein